MNVTLHKLGRNRRLVLRFEWLTLWPVCAVLPVRSQRRDIGLPQALCPQRGPGTLILPGRRRYSEPAVGRQGRMAATRTTGFPLVPGSREGFARRMGVAPDLPL